MKPYFIIQYVFKYPDKAKIFEEIKKYAQQKATWILLNLTQYDIYGDHRSQTLSDNIEWLFRNYVGGYYAYEPKKDKNNQVSFYYLTPWGQSRLSNAQKEELAKTLPKESATILNAMKYYGYNITLRKCIETDLSLSLGYGLKTLSEVAAAKERAIKFNEDKSMKNKVFFYFKDKSSYHLYNISRKWYHQISEFLTTYGAPPKEI